MHSLDSRVPNRCNPPTLQVANKLYPLPYCRDAIQATAREQLEEATQEESAPEGIPQAAEGEDEEGRARLERTESGREAGTSADAAKQKMSLFFGLCYKVGAGSKGSVMQGF